MTYVPARNTLFLALALGLAETLGATDLFIGVNAVDYSGYPDCRPEFIRAFETLANLATRAGVEGARFHVHAPLSGLRKGGDHPDRCAARGGLRADPQLLRPGRRQAAPAGAATAASSAARASGRRAFRIRRRT